MTNQTLQDLLALEAEIKHFKNIELKATIQTENLEELQEIAEKSGLHLYAPFELEQADYYWIYYAVADSDIRITVRTKMIYKRHTTLEEI